MRKKTGGKDFEPGKSGNPGGLRKGARISANDFKDWAFKLWKDNRPELEKTIMSDAKTQMDFLKMLSNFIPKPVEVTGENGGPVIFNVNKRGY